MSTSAALPKRTKKRITIDTVEVERSVYDLARERVEYVLDSFDQVAVSFSGGKDSTATLQVVLDVLRDNPDKWAHHRPLKAYFYDEEAIPFETEQYVRRVGERDDVDLTWFCLPVECRNACSRSSPYWWPWAPEDEHLWTRPLPPEATTEWPGTDWSIPEKRLGAPDLNSFLFDPAKGSFCQMLGIRAQESLSRHRMVTKRVTDNYIVSVTEPGRPAYSKAYPIFDWRTEDVWTAPELFGWDYNRAYDRMEQLGVSHSTQRCSPAFGEEPLQKIHTYASCFPDVWAKMVDRVPGVGAAYRYALTELYGYGAKPTPPPGETWPEHVRGYVEKFAEHSGKVAYRLREELQRHYGQTAQPILPKAPHPISGCSWEFLVMIAMRGDFKKRKNASSHVASEQSAEQWYRYVDEMVSLYSEGDMPDDLPLLANWLGFPGKLFADPHDYLPAALKGQPTDDHPSD